MCLQGQQKRGENMEKQRYVVLDKNGKANIVQKADSRFVGIDEMAQHIAMNVIDDYKSIIDGDKKIEETNIDLSIKVLTAISPFRNGSGFGKDC